MTLDEIVSLTDGQTNERTMLTLESLLRLKIYYQAYETSESEPELEVYVNVCTVQLKAQVQLKNLYNTIFI